MNIAQIKGLKNRLHHYLLEFADCIPRKDTRAHLKTYVLGQLSNLERKSVEPIALEAGMPARTLQEFLSLHRWDEEHLRNRLQELVVRDHSGPNRIGLIDETSYVKKGTKTPGVQRQWCGATGKKENCLVSVHLGYTCGDFHCLLDGDLFLPSSWSEDRKRCEEAGIPDDVVHRPKTDIALELYDEALGNGVRFEWLTFDEGYGGKPPFLRELELRGQRFVGEVPVNFHVWADRPEVIQRPGKTAQVAPDTESPCPVQQLVGDHRLFRDQPWQLYRVKEGQKGPMLWEVKHAHVYLPDEDRLPDKAWHLVVARSVLAPAEVKYFISNAPVPTATPVLLLVAFSRWRIERCFQDDKGQIGLDHYEGRRWQGWQRHLTLSAVSFLFLARVHQVLRKKNPGTDPLPGAYRHFGRGAGVVVGRVLEQDAIRKNGLQATVAPAAQYSSISESYPNNTPETAGVGYQLG